VPKNKMVYLHDRSLCVIASPVLAFDHFHCFCVEQTKP